jgi:hypothetical protein
MGTRDVQNRLDHVIKKKKRASGFFFVLLQWTIHEELVCERRRSWVSCPAHSKPCIPLMSGWFIFVYIRVAFCLWFCSRALFRGFCSNHAKGTTLFENRTYKKKKKNALWGQTYVQKKTLNEGEADELVCERRLIFVCERRRSQWAEVCERRRSCSEPGSGHSKTMYLMYSAFCLWDFVVPRFVYEDFVPRQGGQTSQCAMKP